MPRLLAHTYTISLGYYVLPMAICLVGCGERASSILPEGGMHHIEDQHCWPYNVSVYSVDEVKLGPGFDRYPLDDYFTESKDYEITRWTNYQGIDTALWNGMDSTLKGCNDHTELYDGLMHGDPIYFAGTYRMMFVSNDRRKRDYERILFLDVNNKRLHVFKNINKVF